MSAGVDQKWFSGYALVEGAEVMLTTPEICAVSLGFCLSVCDNFLTNRIFAITSLQAAGNIIISCVCVAHEKYQSNPPDWQDVIVRGWRLLTKRDMRKFKNLCKDGLLGPEDYGIFEDWSATDKSRERYIRIKDGLISEGEVQEMNDEENFYNEGPYEERVRGFFLAYHQVVSYQRRLSFCPADLERFCEFEVSFFGAGNVTDHSHMPFCSNGIKFQHWYAHQANVNEASGLPLILNHMGELVEDKGLGRKVAAEGFEGPGLDTSHEGEDKE